MLGAAVPLILVLGLIVGIVIVAIQRSSHKQPEKSDGADVVVYLLLALSMGVAGFALAQLAATAFPGQSFVFDPADDLATSLAALVVSAPFLIYFWRRQARRREEYPRSAGWTLYLALIELVFVSAFAATAVLYINGLISEEPASAWTGALVFGAIVAFHEYAAKVTPPLSDAGELRRVFGSAIGLITGTIGLVGVLTALFSLLYESGADSAPDPGFHPWVAMLIVGAPIWAYRWLKPWDAKPSVPRLTWGVVVTVGSLALAIGAATGIAVLLLLYLMAETSPAGQHFSTAPALLAASVSGLAVWAIHRRLLSEERGTPLQVYMYAMAALGLLVSVAMISALTIAAFSTTLIVGGGTEAVVTLATILAVGLALWLFFERRAAGTEEVPGRVSWPRRLYSLGMGVVFGLGAAGALITTVFILLRRILGSGAEGSVLEPGTIFVFSGLACWYLLARYTRERDAMAPEDVVAPFAVTLICSHPGMIAAKFPDEARLRVVYRDDDAGVVDEEMADEIVSAIANRPSLVWVDGDGFRIARSRGKT
jgi:hypothetical protein